MVEATLEVRMIMAQQYWVSDRYIKNPVRCYISTASLNRMHDIAGVTNFYIQLCLVWNE